MRKLTITMLFLVVICSVMLRPFCVYAVTPLDTDAKASLTLHYQKDGDGFSGLSIGIYRVAEALPDGTFELIAPFSSFPVNIHDITAQEDWKNIAETINSYIVAKQVAVDYEKKTDENGTVLFDDLKTGLYFIREVITENDRGTYIFNQFMVYLPTPNADGSYIYDVEAKPKCTSFVPKTQYTVTKLWQDAGNQSVRPKEVTVDIYKDGLLYESQILDKNNNWTYTWTVNGETPGKWTVAERSVMSPYKVTIQQNGNVFSVINTYQTVSDSPQTGDSFDPLPWNIATCFSGIMLLLLSIYRRRTA